MRLRNIGRLRAGGSGFSYASLFAAGEPGVHYETYNPDSLLQRRNQLTYSEFPNGTADLTTANGGFVTAGAMSGYSGAIAIGRDGATNQTAYKSIGGTPVFTGAPCVISVVVEMDDGLAPAFGSATGANVANDFNLVVAGGNLSPTTYVVEALGANRYRVSAPFTGSAVTSSYGIIKWSTNSTRTFKTTAWQFDANASVASAYQKVTDWNTEYLAAALGSVGMWQDTVGTPVTAVEQTVGLWLDLSRGLSASATDALNGIGAFNSAAGWTVTGGTGQSITGGQCVFTAMSAIGGYWTNGANPLILNAVYEVSFDIVSINAGGTVTVYAGSVNAVNRTTVGTHRVRMQCAGAGDRDVRVYGQAGTTAVVDNVTFKLVGTATSAHATQATTGSKPKLSARVNLLTKTEQLTDAAWTKTTANCVGGVADPLGGTAAFTVTATAAAGGIYCASTSATGTLNVWARRRTGAGAVNVWNGSVNVPIAVTGAWTLFTVPMAAPTAFLCDITLATSGDAIDVAFPDFRTASDWALNIPAYQRVNTATDYDTAGFIHYLKFDGIDDSLQTAALDCSGVNKMTVWAGVTKLSDAAAGILAELTANATLTSGGFYMGAPGAAAANFSIYELGTGSAEQINYTPFAAPISCTLAAQLDLIAANSAAAIQARVNGAPNAGTSVLSGASTGVFANAILNIGRRNNSAAPFNGRLTSLTVRGSTTPASTAFVQKMEQYAAKLAGQTFTST